MGPLATRQPITPFGRRTKTLAVLAIGAALAAIGWTATRGEGGWPEGPVRAVTLPPGAPLKVFLDAGHGAENNAGNVSAFCEAEQDFTLALAEDVAHRLEAIGGFEVALSRRADELVDYRRRVDEAEAWGADAFVSLHSDVRGEGVSWEPTPGRTCLRSRRAPGFSVIVNDAAAEQGVVLARATARWLGAAGFVPYDGSDYGEVYAADAPGVFFDRHATGERIFVLWRPTMPAILVETHHALDDREVLRWRQEETRVAFAHALAAALREALAPEPTVAREAHLRVGP